MKRGNTAVTSPKVVTRHQVVTTETAEPQRLSLLSPVSLDKINSYTRAIESFDRCGVTGDSGDTGDRSAEDKIAKKRRDSTARKQRSRDRKRRGVCLMSLEVNQGQIADDLVAAGVLKEWDSEDPDRIREALKEAMNMLRVTRDG